MSNPIFSGDNLVWSFYKRFPSKIEGNEFTKENCAELNALLEGNHVTARVAQLVKHLYKCQPSLATASDSEKIRTFKVGPTGEEIKVDIDHLRAAITNQAKVVASWGRLWSLLSQIKNCILGRSRTSTLSEFSSFDKEGHHIFSKDHLESLTTDLRKETEAMLKDSKTCQESLALKPLLDGVIASAAKALTDSAHEDMKALTQNIDKALKAIPKERISFKVKDRGIHSDFFTRIVDGSWRFGWSSKDYHALRQYTKAQVDAYLIPALREHQEDFLKANADKKATRVSLFIDTLTLLVDDITNMKSLTNKEKDEYRKELIGLHKNMLADVLLDSRLEYKNGGIAKKGVSIWESSRDDYDLPFIKERMAFIVKNYNEEDVRGSLIPKLSEIEDSVYKEDGWRFHSGFLQMLNILQDQMDNMKHLSDSDRQSFKNTIKGQYEECLKDQYFATAMERLVRKYKQCNDSSSIERIISYLGEINEKKLKDIFNGLPELALNSGPEKENLFKGVTEKAKKALSDFEKKIKDKIQYMRECDNFFDSVFRDIEEKESKEEFDKIKDSVMLTITKGLNALKDTDPNQIDSCLSNPNWREFKEKVNLIEDRALKEEVLRAVFQQQISLLSKFKYIPRRKDLKTLLGPCVKTSLEDFSLNKTANECKQELEGLIKRAEAVRKSSCDFVAAVKEGNNENILTAKNELNNARSLFKAGFFSKKGLFKDLKDEINFHDVEDAKTAGREMIFYQDLQAALITIRDENFSGT